MARAATELAAVTSDSGLAAVNPESGLARPSTRSLARRGSASLIGAMVSSLAGVLVTVVVTRSVGRAEAGVFFSATSLFLLVTTAARLGSPTGLVYFLSRQRVLDQRERIRATLRVGLIPVAALSLAGSVLLFFVIPEVADSLLRDGQGSSPDELVDTVRALAVLAPMASVYDGVTAATRGLGSMRATVLVERLGRPVAQLVAVGIAGLAGSVVWLSWAWALPYALALAVTVVMLGRLLRHHTAETGRPAGEHLPVVSTGEVARQYWAFTGPRSIANLAQMALQRLDIILIGALRGPVDAAVYTAATRFLVVGQLGAQSISQAVQPSLGELLAKKDIAGAKGVYRISTTWLVVVTWPLYLVAAAVAPLFLAVFGRGYQVGYSVMVLLALTMLVATACGMVDMVLTMAGRTSWNLVNVLVALAVNVGLDVLLIPRWGILGAAVGWSAAILVNNLVPLAQIGLTFGLHPFGRSTLMACLLAGVSFGLVPLAVRLAAGDSVAAMLTGVVVGGVLYLGGLWRWRVLLQLDQLPLRRKRKNHNQQSAQ